MLFESYLEALMATDNPTHEAFIEALQTNRDEKWWPDTAPPPEKLLKMGWFWRSVLGKDKGFIILLVTIGGNEWRRTATALCVRATRILLKLSREEYAIVLTEVTGATYTESMILNMETGKMFQDDASANAVLTSINIWKSVGEN